MTKRTQLLFLLLALITLFTACTPYKKYVTASYYQNASPQTTLAILPVRFSLSGIILDRLDEEEITQYEERESRYFQQALAARIVRKMGAGKRKINVKLQDVNVTNAKLGEAGYQIHDSYDLNPKELGEILDVDAVLLVNINSTQLFSETEASLIEAASIATEILGQGVGVSAAGIPTGSMETTASIVDTKNGELLWATNKQRWTQVRKTPDETMRQLIRIMVRNFPYRNMDYYY